MIDTEQQIDDEEPEIDSESTPKPVGNAKYYISKFLKARKNLEEVKISRLNLLRLSNVEDEKAKLKAKSICIDPCNFHVYIDPERVPSEFVSDHAIEGIDGLFYPYRFTSLKRLSVGILTSRSYQVPSGRLKMLQAKWNNLKNQLHPKLWKSFRHNLSEADNRAAASLLWGSYLPVDRVVKSPVNREAAVTLLISKEFPIVFQYPEYTILSDWKKLYIIVMNGFVTIYSWPGYFDIEAPMKLYVQFRIDMNIVPNLIKFLQDKNYESRKKIYKPIVKRIKNSFFNHNSIILDRIPFINSEMEWRIEKRKEKRLLK
jgi:hypothetical protein